MEPCMMQQKIVDLELRVQAVEGLQQAHMATTDAVKRDTSEIIEFFKALSGAWKVLEFIGKLAKPFTVIATLFAAWFAFKGVK